MGFRRLAGSVSGQASLRQPLLRCVVLLRRVSSALCEFCAAPTDSGGVSGYHSGSIKLCLGVDSVAIVVSVPVCSGPGIDALSHQGRSPYVD